MPCNTIHNDEASIATKKGFATFHWEIETFIFLKWP